jgi:hypothetical protein
MNHIYEDLNQADRKHRLKALQARIKEEKERGDLPEERTHDSNNHVHTFYSFSPYSPTHAAYSAYRAGLTIAGIIDHDTLAGLEEFHRAARLLKIASTGGVEVRVRFDRFNKTINNPDQPGCMYMVAHGVAKRYRRAFDDYLKPYRKARETRNRLMVGRINEAIKAQGVSLDYDKDVRPLSKAAEGGSVTERHLLYALSLAFERTFGQTEELIDAVEKTMGIVVEDRVRKRLLRLDSPTFRYDVLGLLKTDTNAFYVPATDELPDAAKFVRVAKSFGAIPAYAYLGDVSVSVTGDKRPQKFEDDYLEELIENLVKIGVPAIAYMPTRNTEQQIERLQKLALKHDLIEISGEDINSPRQTFTSEAYKDPRFYHLIESAWALVEHERRIDSCEDGLLDSNNFKNARLRVHAFYETIRKQWRNDDV